MRVQYAIEFVYSDYDSHAIAILALRMLEKKMWCRFGPAWWYRDYQVNEMWP